MVKGKARGKLATSVARWVHFAGECPKDKGKGKGGKGFGKRFGKGFGKSEGKGWGESKGDGKGWASSPLRSPTRAIHVARWDIAQQIVVSKAVARTRFTTTKVKVKKFPLKSSGVLAGQYVESAWRRRS